MTVVQCLLIDKSLVCKHLYTLSPHGSPTGDAVDHQYKTLAEFSSSTSTGAFSTQHSQSIPWRIHTNILPRLEQSLSCFLLRHQYPPPEVGGAFRVEGFGPLVSLVTIRGNLMHRSRC